MITFKSTPLFNINLKSIDEKGKEVFKPAFFSELSNLDSQDIMLAKNLKSSWKTPPRIDNYTCTIYGHFMESKNAEYSNKYYVTELIDPNSTQLENTKSILETTNPNAISKNFFYIEYIQSASQNKNQTYQ